MKVLKFYLQLLLFFLSTALFAQVQIDKQIQLTGAGSNAQITGIKNVAANQDAVSVDYIQRDSLKFAVATGSANAYVVTLAPAVTSSYTLGMVVHFKANFANSAAATLQLNSLSPVTIKKNYNVDLAANDIRNGQMVSAMYDGSYFQMLSQLGNASGGGVSSGKQAFLAPGTQYFTVPDGITSVNVKLWGAGGGASSTGAVVGGFTGSGGSGAFVSGSLSVAAGQQLIVIVGEGGNFNGGRTLGGGGAGFYGVSAGGGGRSAIQKVNGTDIVTAGGGGGAGNSTTDFWGNGGGGGAPNGANGLRGNCSTDMGVGGTTSAGGAGGIHCDPLEANGNSGLQYMGGNCGDPYYQQNSGGGGGGGYYGGGGGTNEGGGGGGGSSFVTGVGFALASNIAGATIAGGSAGPAAAGGNSDADYQEGIGAGGYVRRTPGTLPLGNLNGGNGLVVISW